MSMEVKGNMYVYGDYVEQKTVNVQGDQHNYFGKQDESSATHSEQVIIDAINALLEASDNAGNRIFADRGQWYAVYRVLSELHRYPTKMTDFCRIMAEYGYDRVAVPCKYDSIAERNKNLTNLGVKVTLWNNYKNCGEQYKKQCDVVAFLTEKLGDN